MRFRRPRVLIVGCGDIGGRIVRASGSRWRTMALTSSPSRVNELRAMGVVPLQGDLDDGATLARFAGLATRVLHLAPPPASGHGDPRTRALVHALARRSLPRALVYISTSGVYGDCHGDWVPETRPAAPATLRARRRSDAEASLRGFGLTGVRVGLLRVPGIYAGDRPGGGVRARLLSGGQLPRTQEDPYVNHIHADDLARACALALWRARPQRVYNLSDQSALRMGEYLDLAADLFGLARLPRMHTLLAESAEATGWTSFLKESRRLLARRMQEELGLSLRYPSVREGLMADLERQRR